MSYPVAIVGVGNMGGGMAHRLLSQGWPVHVFDIVADRMAALASAGAQAHASAAQAASAARATIVCVVDAGQSRDVLFGAGALAQAVPLGHSVLLCPTIAPADVEDIAAALRPKGLKRTRDGAGSCRTSAGAGAGAVFRHGGQTAAADRGAERRHRAAGHGSIGRRGAQRTHGAVRAASAA